MRREERTGEERREGRGVGRIREERSSEERRKGKAVAEKSGTKKDK